jgi:hypothetical protein
MGQAENQLGPYPRGLRRAAERHLPVYQGTWPAAPCPDGQPQQPAAAHGAEMVCNLRPPKEE